MLKTVYKGDREISIASNKLNYFKEMGWSVEKPVKAPDPAPVKSVSSESKKGSPDPAPIKKTASKTSGSETK